LTQLPSRFRCPDRTQDGAEAQPARSRSPIGLGHLLLSVVVVALIALNGATLLSDRIHSWAYGIVSPVVQAICGTACLENSPTEIRRTEVARATREAEERVAALQVKIEGHIATIAMLVAANDVLLPAVYRLVTEHLALEQSHRGLKAAANGLAAKMAHRLRVGATRKVASMASQAIPYVGVTVIWAVAVLDVKDACDSMRALADLGTEAGGNHVVDAKFVCGLRVPSVDELIQLVVSRSREAFQEAAEVINGDGRVVIVWDVVRWPYDRVKNTICYIFGC